jgi:hypothetical protein
LLSQSLGLQGKTKTNTMAATTITTHGTARQRQTTNDKQEWVIYPKNGFEGGLYLRSLKKKETVVVCCLLLPNLSGQGKKT